MLRLILGTLVLLVLAVGSLPLTFLLTWRDPFVFWAGELILLFAGAAIFIRSKRTRFVTVNAIALVLAFGLAEAWFAGWFGSGTAPGPRVVQSGSRMAFGYIVHDPVRGYAARKGAVVTHRKTIDGRVAYDVTYTIDEAGRRVTPPAPPSAPAVLFFGGSFTFGDGVEDRESMPWVFGRLAGDRYRALNLGLHGYGPQQMLRLLETGMEELLDGRRPAVAVYQALPPHIARAAGRYPWVVWGGESPHYVLDAAGKPVYRGPFLSRFKTYALMGLNKSHLMKRILVRALGEEPTKGDVDLFIAIVDRSRRIFLERYGRRFLVVAWPAGKSPFWAAAIRELRRRGIEVVTTEEIFAPFGDSPGAIRIEGDGHPSPLAHKRIAAHLLRLLARGR